jgi:hypothetical protein
VKLALDDLAVALALEIFLLQESPTAEASIQINVKEDGIRRPFARDQKANIENSPRRRFDVLGDSLRLRRFLVVVVLSERDAVNANLRLDSGVRFRDSHDVAWDGAVKRVGSKKKGRYEKLGGKAELARWETRMSGESGQKERRER